MKDHPIQGLMETSMESIKDMVDVNTIVGEAVQTPNGDVIIPISKVSFGFAAGGSDYNVSGQHHHAAQSENASVAPPFGGGTGGGISITPISFLVVGAQGVKVVPLDNQTHIWEKLIDNAPMWVDKIKSAFNSRHTDTHTEYDRADAPTFKNPNPMM